MSQRNPMNERYQSEQPKGQTKRSAASMKPKSKAASSVYVRPTEKTPQEKKAIRKQQRARQAELDRQYYNPPTAEYKRLRKLWWVLLVCAIVLTVLAMFSGNMFPDSSFATWGLLIPAYGCIIGALYLDFSKIRKVRRAYQMEMIKKHPKEAKKHQVTHAANVHGEMKDAQRAAKKGTGRFSRIFGMKKKSADEAQAEPEATAQSAEEAKAAADAAKPIAQLKAERAAAKKAEKSEKAGSENEAEGK